MMAAKPLVSNPFLAAQLLNEVRLTTNIAQTLQYAQEHFGQDKNAAVRFIVETSQALLQGQKFSPNVSESSLPIRVIGKHAEALIMARATRSTTQIQEAEKGLDKAIEDFVKNSDGKPMHPEVIPLVKATKIIATSDRFIDTTTARSQGRQV